MPTIKSMGRRQRIAKLLPGGFALLLPMTAFSQAGQPPAQAISTGALAGAQETLGDLEEVIVTARKRAESLQDVPIAITAISGEQLERQSLTSIEKIGEVTPQLIVVRGTSGSGASLNLRGIGSSFTSIGIEQSVAVNVDGVYYGQGRVINEGFLDLQQVEILKGPQALFFGKNASAGVLSFTTANPGPAFEGMARVGYEMNSEQTSVEGMLSGPVSDTIGLRLAVRGSEMTGGHIENIGQATTFTTQDVAAGFVATTHDVPAPQRDVPGERELLGRLTATWKPSDDFTMTLKGSGNRYRIDNATWINEMTSCPLGSAQVNPGETCRGDWRIQQNDVPADIAATNPIMKRHGGRLYQDYDSYGGSATLAYENETLALNSVTGYHHFKNYFLGDYDGTGAADGGTWGAEVSEYRAWSTEQRVQTKLASPVNFMLGLYTQSTRLDFQQDVIFPRLSVFGFVGAFEDSGAADPSARYLTLRKLSKTDGDTFAVFGQTLWEFQPNWELAAGLRYTHETKRSTFAQPYVTPLYQATFVQFDPGDPTTQLAADQTFENISPEATLTWRPAANLTLYGGYKRGFKSGGFSGSALYSVNTTVDDLAFDPEKAAGFEGGVKSTLLDDRLRLNAAVYRYKYDDLQVDFFDSTAIQFITTNAGSSITRGVELDATWLPLTGLTIDANVSYNDAYYDSFAGSPCYGGQTPAQGCTINPVTSRPEQDQSGKPTARAPEWVGTLRTNYDTTIGAGLLFGASIGARYTGEYALNSFGDRLAVQGGFVALDGGLRLGSGDQRWECALIGKNLTDKYALTYAQDAPSSGAGSGTVGGIPSDQLGNPIFPRTVQLQFTYRYE